MDNSSESENLIKEVIENIGSGLFGLHLKGPLMDKLFTMSKNWPWTEKSFRVSKVSKLKVSEHRK